MAKLTQEQRDKLPDRLYALPSKRMFPMPDEKHTRLAWDMVKRAKGLTEEERQEARRRILRRAKELGIDTSNWDKSKLKAEEDDTLALQAARSNIFIDNTEHPNKMPFKGILTYFDVPSDRAPGGASGMKVVIPSEVGIPALASLKGMAVNYVEGTWDGHDPQRKIGVITDAYAGEPLQDGAVPVYVEGYIYSHDFEDVAFEIKANQSQLGFSYETAMTRLEPGEFNGEPVLYVRELGYFTGASILLKAHAAYQNTSIAANAAEGGFNVEELRELLASAVNELKQYVDEKLEALKAEAEKDEKKDEKIEEKPAEIEEKRDLNAKKQEKIDKKADEKEDEEEDAEDGGMDEEEEGEADEKGKAKGKLKASADDLLEELKALREEIAALKPKKVEIKADITPPERKSVAFPRTLMAKYAVDEEDDIEKAMKAISERKDLDVEQRMALKFELMDKQRKQQ